MIWIRCLSFGFLLLHQVTSHVFLDADVANGVLSRQRRANTFWEEMKKGNMERECVEERCSWEEAREIFEDDKKTNEFWAKYVDGDACLSMPCVNNGLCKDTIGSYTCYCQAGFQGFNCEIVIPELCENKNGGCEHFCTVHDRVIHCSCADRYFLGPDDKSCFSNQTYKCGSIVTQNTRSVFIYERPNSTETNNTGWNLTDLVRNANFSEQEFFVPHNSSDESLPMVKEEEIFPDRSMLTRIVNGEECPPGECPWQALLLNEDHRGFCGGTILTEYIILTAAHCMNQSRYIFVILGEFDTEAVSGNEVVHDVEVILTHRWYKQDTYHNDIALIKLTKPIKFTRFILPACIPERDFAENVLMQQPDGMVSGFGRVGEGRQPSTILQRLTMPYVDRATCIESSQFRISSHMFCAGYDTEEKDACQGDSGGPHVTRYHNTYFITGIVSWGEGCARKGKYGVYTQVSKFIRWIREGIKTLESKQRHGRRPKRADTPFNKVDAPFTWLYLVMAVGVMSPHSRVSVLGLFLLACFLQVFTRQVFRLVPEAHSVFLRSKRANSFLVEEIFQGNLERECYEERCNYEEAREYFEDDDKTIAFWTLYYDGGNCNPNPCLHGGNCTNKAGGFQCLCAPPHYGLTCELGRPALPVTPSTAPQASVPDEHECPTEGPTACHQFCTTFTYMFICSCLPGFKLQPDGRSCVPKVELPCGQASNKLSTTTPTCSHGSCPWQVSVMDSRGAELCGGVVLGQRSVLTAAHCLFQDSGSDPQPSNFYVAAGNEVSKVLVRIQALYLHNRFSRDHHDNDLAVLQLDRPLTFGPALFHLCLPTKDFSENILMHSGRAGLTAGHPNGQSQELVYITLDECRNQLNVTHPLSNKMFCMRSQNGPVRNQDRLSPSRPVGNRDRPSPSRPVGNRERPSPSRPVGNRERPSHSGPGGNRDRPSHSRPGGNRGRPSQSGPVGNRDRPSQSGPVGNQDQLTPSGLVMNKPRTPGGSNRPLGFQNQTTDKQNRPVGNQDNTQLTPNGPVGTQNEVQGGPFGPLEKQNHNLGKPTGSLETQNGGHWNANVSMRTPNRPHGLMDTSRSKVSSGQSSNLLPGSPVATEEKGTAFLTGLLISSSTDGSREDGLVFAKVSRYLDWIRLRLEVTEGHMTSPN
ncbi:uncharacterized protein LOC117520127 [Thalassophryne amazonica]|uniref:uncharacterized protein LOC117520127 n=1 Tax=Thalassophryne amazonica TaxID=390379 RepID=UPI001470B2D2|nr:uncharacterized protein LOC117520127 [Thalassophryne amazonica]